MRQFMLILTLSILASFRVYGQETFKVGNTEYYHGKYYSTTGKPLVKRSEANKRDFLQSLGYNEVPYGYEIDHIKPLSEGGTDDPSNMQLLTVEQHKRKTARERANRSNLTYPTTIRSYYSNSTHNSFYNRSSNSNSTYSGIDNEGRIIYSGSGGGKFYINSSGKKVYVKSEKSTTNSTYSSPSYSSPSYSSPSYSSPSYSSPSYSSPSSSSHRTIQTGPRGGQYYINSNGNKTYVKKKN